MANLITSYGPALAEITPEERERLLRYCARVTGDVHAAEDLVQQTLLEAWLHAARIQTPDLRGPNASTWTRPPRPGTTRITSMVSPGSSSAGRRMSASMD